MRAPSSSPTHRGLATALWLTILAFCAVGCSETTPLTGPEPPGGGDTYVLSYEGYLDLVAPVVASEGCNADGACHGGGIRGTFALSPESDPDPEFDFEQAALQVNGYAPGDSPLLLKPLDENAGGQPHSYDAFESTNEAGYLAILNWIEQGEFQ